METTDRRRSRRQSAQPSKACAGLRRLRCSYRPARHTCCQLGHINASSCCGSGTGTGTDTVRLCSTHTTILDRPRRDCAIASHAIAGRARRCGRDSRRLRRSRSHRRHGQRRIRPRSHHRSSHRSGRRLAADETPCALRARRRSASVCAPLPPVERSFVTRRRPLPCIRAF